MSAWWFEGTDLYHLKPERGAGRFLLHDNSLGGKNTLNFFNRINDKDMFEAPQSARTFLLFHISFAYLRKINRDCHMAGGLIAVNLQLVSAQFSNTSLDAPTVGKKKQDFRV